MSEQKEDPTAHARYLKFRDIRIIRASYLQKAIHIFTKPSHSNHASAHNSVLDKSKDEENSSGQTSEGQVVKVPHTRNGSDAEKLGVKGQSTGMGMQAVQHTENGRQRGEREVATPRSQASSSSKVESLAKWREPGPWPVPEESIELQADLQASPRCADILQPASNSATMYEEISVAPPCAKTPLSVPSFSSETKKRWSFQEAHSESQCAWDLGFSVPNHERGMVSRAIVMDWTSLNFGQATDAEKAVSCEDFFARQVSHLFLHVCMTRT